MMYLCSLYVLLLGFDQTEIALYSRTGPLGILRARVVHKNSDLSPTRTDVVDSHYPVGSRHQGRRAAGMTALAPRTGPSQGEWERKRL